MKKIVGILIALVIVLGGLLVYDFFNENKEVMKEEKENQPVSNSEMYQIQDIESMEKAKTVGEVIDHFFVNDRLVKTEENKDMFKEYYKEKITTGVMIPFFMKPGSDSRMEMIDFLHYIQFSGLTENAWGKTYWIQMNVFQPIKPGMNLPEPHQKWGIDTEMVKDMDFSDKETMLGEIHRYGKFEGVNPSGMKTSQ